MRVGDELALMTTVSNSFALEWMTSLYSYI